MENIKSFNSLRFILAIFICWHHIGINIFENDVNKYFRTAYLAVECFFILAGFLMAKSFYAKYIFDKTSAGFGVFFLSRIKRLYPEFIFCLLISYVLMKAFGIDISLKFLFLNGIMLGDLCGIPTIIGGMWFVTVLFWLGSFIYALTFFFKEKALYLFIPILAILSLFFLTSNVRFIGGHSQPLLANFLSYGALRGMLGLSVGIFAYMIVEFINNRDWSKINKKNFNAILIFLELYCVIELIRIVLLCNSGDLRDFKVYFVFSFIVILLFYRKEFFLKVLSNPFLVKTGSISYILYLSHLTLLAILRKYSIFAEMNIVAMYAIVTISCIIFATILYFLYKKTSSLVVNFITVKS